MNDVFTQFLPPMLAFILFTLGIRLNLDDFNRVFKFPKAIGVGILCQIIVLPVIVFTIIFIFKISNEFVLGFVILAVCPGGVTSNYFTRLANGDVALSVTMTALTTIFSVVTIPIMLSLAKLLLDHDLVGSINVVRVSLAMFVFALLPVIFGVILNTTLRNFSENIKKGLGVIAFITFVLVVIATVLMNIRLFALNVVQIGLPLIVIFTLLLIIGIYLSKLFGLPPKVSSTISIETAIQNPTLGITLAGLLSSNASNFSPYSLPIAVYGVLMLFLVIPVTFYFKNK